MKIAEDIKKLEEKIKEMEVGLMRKVELKEIREVTD